MDSSIDNFKSPYAAPSNFAFTVNVRDA